MGKNKLNLIITLACITLIVLQTQNSTRLCPNQSIQRTPQKFAIQTMTYSRSFTYHDQTPMTVFQKYLDHYANLNCDCFDNIYIIWNNQESPQERGIKKSNKWIKNVIYTKTPYNSLGWKYSIPSSAPEQLFFTVDDDLYFTCQQLKTGFSLWKQHSVGTIGPLVSFTKRTMFYRVPNQQFTYQFKYFQHFYTFSLMNCAFFSRQFADLYYSQFQQIKGIRKFVQESHNCQDIAMNFIVSYFYPQLIPIASEQKIAAIANKGISSTPDHLKKRSNCIMQFTKLLKFNPLRYISVDNVKSQRQFDQSCPILAKNKFYSQTIKRKTPQQIFEMDKIFNPHLYDKGNFSLIQKQQIKKIDQSKQQAKQKANQTSFNQNQKTSIKQQKIKQNQQKQKSNQKKQIIITQYIFLQISQPKNLFFS